MNKLGRKFHLIVLLLLMLISSYTSAPAQSSSYNSGLAKIGDVLFDQKIQLIQFPGKGDDDMTSFQKCLKRDSTWNQAGYLFSIEGEEISSCLPKGFPVHWKRVTFEGEEEPIKIDWLTEQRGQNLILKSLHPDIASFYCSWEYQHDGQFVPIVGGVWTVETIALDKLEKESARQWRMNKSNQATTPHQVSVFKGTERLELGTDWKRWSECSKCGAVGKRHRVGVCTVASLSRPDTLSRFLALNIYKSPISCSLFLDLHPEVVSDGVDLKNFEESQEQIHEFGRRHRILVGYCKKAMCSGWKASYARNLISKKVYAEFPLLGEKGRGGENAGGRSIMSLMRNLLRGVPLGWNSLPELITLLSLISVQCYIIYLILKNRQNAN